MKSATNKPDSKEGLYIQEFPSAIEAFEIEQGINKPEAWPLCIEISKRYNERKALLDRLELVLAFCKSILFIFGNEANYPEGTIGYNKKLDAEDQIKNIEELLKNQ